MAHEKQCKKRHAIFNLSKTDHFFRSYDASYNTFVIHFRKEEMQTTLPQPFSDFCFLSDFSNSRKNEWPETHKVSNNLTDLVCPQIL